MKLICSKFLYLLVALQLVFAGAAGQQKQSFTAAKKKEKIERSYKKAYARARKRTIKHRYEIQSKNTKEMMDAAGKRADAFNKQNDTKCIDRIFKKRRYAKR
jgi:hypothetical protein